MYYIMHDKSKFYMYPDKRSEAPAEQSFTRSRSVLGERRHELCMGSQNLVLHLKK